MNDRPTTYAVITPAKNEADNLPRLAATLAAQTIPPSRWVIVDNGSSDATAAFGEGLAATHPWTSVLRVPGEPGIVRGAPVVRAFNAGLSSLAAVPDVVVKLDADVSFAEDFFERLLQAFSDDPSLGIAGGTCYELQSGTWRPMFATGGHVRGATRAYRRECLEQILPLEETMGWDGIDELRATLRGWRTASLPEVPFYHHRAVGERDGARRRAYAAQGRASWYMGYRFWYLVVRSLHHARREPAAFAMVTAYLRSAIERTERCGDAEVRSYLRDQQSLRRLPLRVREAFGRRSSRAVA